ncbi:Hypothetical protein CpMEX30_0623 [Corynebacterium pseudotuberculosis]|uniref:hypothetical protein n=1 Tax=Corynebacterium pseudotuberculosis TaxID=1719 RepID=UPI0002605FFE|nr:hypothetical protein [Corynebacterium pseudotuberculosis]AKS12929.1 Hypothetical protein CpE19_0588 [Corynebacterium pseudotuberculosis]AMN71483.1 toxin HicA [Corynebacterium pseudotuberculosis]AMN73861.1 toxin HicA [Corynebacterium pseudotuberculosis]AMN75394.1 toxin HicA [Corynebacterium pseudotuberculosis]ANZ91541.1 toxin HicA [Corynebacterium pseudotuberculosis]
MTKRKDVIRKIRKHAQQTEQPMTIKEGSSHTKIQVGNHVTYLPRHTEISPHTADAIYKQIGIQ